MDVAGELIELKAQLAAATAQMAETRATLERAASSGEEWGVGDGIGLPVGEIGDGCFIVRWHQPEGEQGQWEIYLPPGCVSVGGTCEPINRKAGETSGHSDEEEERNWYRFALDESQGEDETRTVIGVDGENETVEYRRWKVVVHAKISAKVTGEDALDVTARRLVFVSAEPYMGQGELDEEERWEAYLGDEFSQVVATAYKETGTEGTTRRAEQHVSTAIGVQGRTRSNFDLVWYLSVNEGDAKVSVDRIYCLRNEMTVAGMAVKGNNMVEVTPFKTMDGNLHEIYAMIRSNENSGENVIEVVVDPRNMSTDDYTTWLKLYERHAGNQADFRSSSLANVQVYR